MQTAAFEEVNCRTALTPLRAHSSFVVRWSLNPYRCGEHAGGGRRTLHQRIVAKVNLPGVLRRELRHPDWRRERVAVGTQCDPYQPAELKYGLTRDALEALRDNANPCLIITQSPGILRDLPLLRDLSGVAECTVLFRVATLREEICRHIEPDAAPPSSRLEAVARLAEAGIRCAVSPSPAIPGLTDGIENLEAVARAAEERGASFVADVGLVPQPGCGQRAAIRHHDALHAPPLRPKGLLLAALGPGRHAKDAGAAQELRERWRLAPYRVAQQPLGQLELAF